MQSDIDTLKTEIANLRRTLNQPCELEEDIELWDLQNIVDDLMKERDDQLETLQGI